MSASRKVLIVSFDFPPANLSGSVRIGKLAKYLPQFGWEPMVLTVDRVKGARESLPVEMDAGNVFRTPYFDLDATFGIGQKPAGGGGPASPGRPARHGELKRAAYRLITKFRPIYNCAPLQILYGEHVGWYANGVRKGREILHRHDVDALFSSCKPLMSHVIAARLHAETGIPWVADYRDVWSVDPDQKMIWPFQSLAERYERRLLSGSSSLITVSSPLARQLEALHGRKVSLVTNGFDDADYVESVPPTSRFTITYTGSVSSQRDPGMLLQAVKELRQDGRLSPDDFEIRFFGDSSLQTEVLPKIEKYHLQDLARVYGPVPFKESIQRQQESSALLLLESLGAQCPGNLTAKVFEYLGAGRPVLAIANRESAIAGLLEESGGGVLADNVQQVKEVLSRWLGEWRQERRVISHWKPDRSVIQTYTRRAQAKMVAGLLDEAVPQRCLTKPVFVFSLDVELLWGPHSWTPEAAAAREDRELGRGVVRVLLDLFARHGIPATWAMIGHLLLESCQKQDESHRKLLSSDPVRYALDPGSNIRESPMFYGTDIVEMIRSHPVGHEIGCHGFFHMPFDEFDADLATADIESGIKAAQQLGVSPESFVFPGNRIGWANLLAGAGFKVYRGRLLTHFRLGQNLLIRTLSDVADKLLATPVDPVWKDGIWELPASMFFPDRRFPFTILPRARLGLYRAIKGKKVFHVFLHPHDLLVQPSLAKKLDRFLAVVARERAAGRLETMTMGQLASHLEGKTAPEPVSDRD